MHSLLAQPKLWEAVITVLILSALDDIVTRHLWEPVAQSFLRYLPGEYWDDDTKQLAQDAAASSRSSSGTFYLLELPRGLLENLVIQVLAYYNQHMLDWLLPSRPLIATLDSTSKAEQKEKEIRGREEMEMEIMQKLIAEGRVKPTGINWRNVILKWLLDDIAGTLVFAVIAFLLHCATNMHSPAYIASEFPTAIANQFLEYWFSARPWIALVGFAYVPAQQRLQFWTAADLGLNIIMSVLLRALVPVVMNSAWLQDFLRQSAQQAQRDAWLDREWARFDAENDQIGQDIANMIAGWKDNEKEL